MAEHDPLQRPYPKRRKVVPRYKPPTYFELPPMPALEELVPPPVRDGNTRQPTAPPSQAETRANELSTPEHHASHSMEDRSPNLASSRLQPLKKRQRSRRWFLTLATLLLALTVLGGTVAAGLYVIQTDILAPLSQFFHPLSGGENGSINGRAWNLLLLGSDDDGKFTFPDLLTQVMMVVHVDPLNNSVYMVSIPRDSWVPVPGQVGMYKIDQAFDLGAAAHRSFDDGVRLAQATIEQDYGVSIDRYAWVGLEGFASVINTLGGIDIDVTHPILDDNYPDDTSQGSQPVDPYAIQRLYLPPGPQHLDGEQALEYVRSRHADLIGDIGRTQRQQEVLAALKKKLNAPSIFNHLPELFHDLAGKIYTDLNENELLSLANFARSLPSGSIKQLTLGPGQGNQNYGSIGQTNVPGPDGSQDIIVPNCSNIQPVINQIFNLGDTQSCQINGSG